MGRKVLVFSSIFILQLLSVFLGRYGRHGAFDTRYSGTRRQRPRSYTPRHRFKQMGESLDARNLVRFPAYISAIEIHRKYCSQNAGQNCIGIERLIVHKLQYDDLEKIITERVQILRSGSVLAPSQEGYISTVDSGSMISRDRFLGLQQLIRKAEEAGAKVVGGQPLTHVYLEHGSYFQGTVVGPVHNNMDIAQQERA